MRGRIKVDRRFLTCMKIRVSPLLSFLSFMATDPISNSSPSPKSNAWTITHCSFLLLHHLYEIPLLPPSLSNLSVTTLPHYLLNTQTSINPCPRQCVSNHPTLTRLLHGPRRVPQNNCDKLVSIDRDDSLYQSDAFEVVLVGVETRGESPGICCCSRC